MIAGGSAAAAADRQQRNRGGASRPFSLLPGRCQMLPNRLGSTHYNPLITNKMVVVAVSGEPVSVQFSLIGAEKQ
ncbi:hypothetical protein [Mesorhizobium sp.]|uniref:hypothetical protein n=1 Tax=Mesorhizobium sp. TaxID=1871066 RepID=UPI000FE50BD1|nr:hypothetical protein [Mesorhizobium sp.]RWO54245.1 MAG: hypothetical protein EOS14_31895 [Mesorhizobium sp.]